MDWPNPPRARDGFRHEAGYFIHIPTRPGAWFGALSRISDAPVQGAEFINPGSVIEFEPIRMTLSSLSREKGDPVVTQGWLNPGPETDVAVVTNAKPSLAKLSAATQTEIAAMTDDPVIAVAKYP